MAPGSVYYPKYQDMTAEESAKLLRQLELEAYSAVISALRSQGDLTKEKRGLLSELLACLGITEERHKAEIRRAVSDEKLATIALHSAGRLCEVEWTKEGRRALRLRHRPLQITSYMQEADRIAEMIAAENASIPEPTTIDVDKLVGRSTRKPDPPEKPLEVSVQYGMRLHSSLYCVGCISKHNNLVDASTSTNDLEVKKKEFNPTMASDDCIHLPSGTVVRVSTMKLEKEATDAYCYDSNLSGNYDFGSAPEISLTDSKSSKRKRKKSSGYIPPKEGVVTIRQVIRPPTEEKLSNPSEDVSAPSKRQSVESHRKEHVTSKNDGKLHARSKLSTTEGETPRRSSESTSKKKKKLSSQASAIQHTPVPPEHLYAVGSGTVPRSQHSSHGLIIDNNTPMHDPSKPDYTISTDHSPGMGMQPNRPPHVFSPTYSTTFSHATWQTQHEPIPDPTTSYSHGFRYSPTKPGYRPQKVGLGPLSSRSPKVSHAKKHRMSPYSFTKRVGDSEYDGQRSVKRISTKKDMPGKYSGDIPGPHKMYRPTFNRSIPAHYQPTDTVSEVQTIQEVSKLPAPHSSTLEEFASVSLMASGLSATTIVETGLAPVSAIVSRVTSPAPGPASSAPSIKKSVSLPLVVSRIHGEEGASVQMQKIVHAQPAGDVVVSAVAPRQLSVMTPSSFATTKLKIQGSIGSVTTSNAITQVRLAVTSSDNATMASVPISFTSSLPQPVHTLSAQIPRVISTVPGKSSTLLKSSSGNMITVTAKPLTPGVRASVPTIVTGANIVKPQIGPKTSIIVVHKAAAGSKIGKTMPTNFPGIGAEGSKVITVSTKNLTTSSTESPKYSPGNAEDASSESALGSIQGLVSGLNPSGIVKKAKVVGMKPKFITMPIHKKPVPSKITEVSKAKIIQNIIKAPGKVLVKTAGTSTLSSVQLKTIPTAKIMKPIEFHAAPSHDIVAAALSQSLGSVVSSEGPVAIPSDTSTFTKVATSTPAASTIKAIAASYQKNTSVGQHKQTQVVQSPSFSLHDKTKVIISSSPSQTQPMLFTPHQPQVHRSPQSGSQRPKSIFQPTLSKSTLQTVTSASNYSAPAFNNEKPPVTAVNAQPPVMQLKMLNQPTSTQASQQLVFAEERNVSLANVEELPTQSWNALATSSSEDRQTAQLIANPSTVSSGERATFIYQYHATSHANTAPQTLLQRADLPLSMPSIGPGDMITLHSIKGNPEPAESGSEKGSVEIAYPAPQHQPQVCNTADLINPSQILPDELYQSNATTIDSGFTGGSEHDDPLS